MERLQGFYRYIISTSFPALRMLISLPHTSKTLTGSVFQENKGEGKDGLPKYESPASPSAILVTCDAATTTPGRTWGP